MSLAENSSSPDPLPEGIIEQLESSFRGQLIQPGSEKYDQARRVWNGMIDKHPAVIARCTGTADVVEAVNVARENELELSVRGGGHNVAGTALCENGIVIDLEPMNGVDVDPDAHRVRVGGGATWAEVDRETQLFGLATPGGVVSDTGIAGLTLGGGLGHLRRKHGLSCDALASVEVVTSDGEVVRASEQRNSDLFWALRGGGGNFGVVTSFEYELYAVGPEVSTCFVWYPADEGEEVLNQFDGYCRTCPDEVSLIVLYAIVPELPEVFPEEHFGQPSVAILGCHSGAVDQGEKELRKVRNFTEPLVDLSGNMPYTELQSMLDEDYPEGRRYYWKSLYLNDLGDDVVEQFMDCAEAMPSDLSTVDFWQLGGAISRVDSTDTAFAHRDAEYLLGIEANWDDPEKDEENLEWVRETFEAFEEFSRGGVYVNFPGFGEGGDELVRAVYEDNLQRLADVKADYDPDNLFAHNQNIKPSS